MTTAVTFGVRPGPKFTGLALRQGQALLFGAVLARQAGEDLDAYAARVRDLVDAVRAVRAPAAQLHIQGAPAGSFGPRLRATLAELREVLEVLLVQFPDAVVIPHGERPTLPTSRLPRELRTRRGQPWPAELGPMQHPRGERAAVYEAWALTFYSPAPPGLSHPTARLVAAGRRQPASGRTATGRSPSRGGGDG